jgi:ParB family chromosome partitioning protein
MLGKGLESLIPQKGGQGAGDGGTSDESGTQANTPAFDPSDVNPATSAQPQKDFPANDPPPLELPILEDELDLPAGQYEPALASGDEPRIVNQEPQAQEKKEGPAAFALSNKPADPVVTPLSQSSISVAARNVNIGGPSGTYETRPVAKSSGPTNAAVDKPALGRDPVVAASVFHIETEKIMPNANQPRRHFDEGALKDMAYSIREFGILQPLVVTRVKKETPHGVDVEYELIAGERRLLAAKMIGLKTVPAIIRNIDFEREKLELAIIENIQREALNPLETARAFERLRDEFKLTQREIAAKLGKSREVVANTVRLLDLPTFAQEALEKGRLSESHARFLLSVDDPAAQKKLFNDILEHGLTTRDVQERVQQFGGKRGRGRPPGKGTRTITPELKAIQDELSSELGAPVEIERKANTGKITITFYSEEELDNILKKIGKEEQKNNGL